MKKFQDKLEKLNLAYNSLKEMIEFGNTANISLEKFDEALRDSIIKKFEYTFELSWKTIKAYLEEEGYEEMSSPRKVLKQAFESNIIADEEVWSNMLEARNSTAHTYDEEKAIYYEDVIKNKYVKKLDELIKKLNEVK
ncbi:MAG TPA: nucleotidyltransferase substrate binding protein [Candidatus Aphodocola excrementigallinarum]|uniref:Nucleotidyltransferase substrate binding protein n=1 Tax=Candidatus Aphodocola excrementigallinarum TaxID=2840670 RepID=A0A9D1LID2_9FIRM|nr:nucleotidyltransferase substrate binding protein [Candidatus Aphodocola excrementigallinarum]